MDAVSDTPPALARDRLRWLLLAGCGAVLLSRVVFLPPTLEDIDSVNFALALERFDPRLHQPHPPGYPVYIALAKLIHAGVPDPPRALGWLSALAQALLVVPLFALFRRISSTSERAILATLLALACPILWFNGARPMSDSVGLLFVISTQALLFRSLDGGGTLPAASLLAGLSLGVRLQTGLLTIPLWILALVRTRRWGIPVAALGGGMALWVVPLMIASGGPAEYARALTQTMGDAAGSEPLIVGFTLNRAVRAVVKVVLAPWVSPLLGSLVSVLAGLGFLRVAVRRPVRAATAAVAFLPYLSFHTLVQQAETVRYSLPYLPWIAWLAVEGLGFFSDRIRRPVLLERAVVGGFITASMVLTLPALAVYHVIPSPPYAALAAAQDRSRNPREWVLAGHYMFSRYFPDRGEGLDVLAAAPGKTMSRLASHFRNGDTRKVLFLADPGRTDLASFSRDARRFLGRWEWPVELRPFLSGERPNEAELFEMVQPNLLVDRGFLLSLEMGRIEDVGRDPVREAYLKPLSDPSFVLVAGVPTGPTSDCALDIEVAGLLDADAQCETSLLRGYLLPPAEVRSDYLRLTAVSHSGGGPAGMPFALKGLDYGPTSATGFVRGEGWFFPEKDETLRWFRWASPHARSLLHVPAGGARLIVEGTAPLEYLGNDVGIEISENGLTLASVRLKEGRFRLEAKFIGGDPAFREIVLSTSRGFVPDEMQKNGDMRRLAVRVYGFSLVAGGETP